MSDLQTGDLLLFRGSSVWTSILRQAQQSDYTHCAMVLRSPTWIDERLTGMYFIEAGREVVPDPATGQSATWGVHIQPIEAAWMGGSDSDTVWHRRVNCTRDADFYERLTQAYAHVSRKPYSRDVRDWLNALLFVRTGEHLDVSMPESDYDTEYWCSSLLGCLYVHLGLLPADTVWSLLAPTAFSAQEHRTTLAWTCPVDMEFLLLRPPAEQA